MQKYLVPICLTLLLVLVGSYVFRLEGQRVEQQQANIKDEIENHAALVGHQVEQAIAATEILAAIVRQYGDIRNFDSVAASVITSYSISAVSALQLAPNAVVSRIYPLSGHENAIGHDLLKDPDRRNDVLEAIRSRKLVISGPFTLIQGGEAIVGRLPIFLPDGKGGERFWGLAIALIRIPNLIKASHLDEFNRDGFDYSISYASGSGSEEKLIHRSAGSLELNEPVIRRVRLPNGSELTLSVAPQPGRVASSPLFGEIALLVLASVLLAAFSYQLVRRHEMLELQVQSRTRSLVEANRRLEQEVLERTKAQEDLRLSNRFLDSVVDNIPHMVFVKDASELKFVRFNKAGEELTGFLRHDMYGKSDHDFFPREEADFFIAKDRETLATGELSDIPEEQIKTRFKGTRYLHTKKIPLLDENGKPRYLLGISEDITDRKLVEDKLHESEELFRAIAENAGDLIAMVDTDGRRIYNNPSYRNVFGTAPPQPNFDSFTEIHPEDRERIRAIFQRTVAKGVGERAEFRFLLPDGGIRHIESEGSVIRDPAGRVSKVVVVSRDITERMRTEQALRDQLHFIEQLVDAIPTPVFFKDGSGRYLGCNRAFEAFLGKPRSQIIGKSLHDIFPKDLADSFDRIDNGVLRHPGTLSYEERVLVHADGSQHDVLIHKATFSRTDQSVGGLVGVMFDITDRKISEEKLRLAARVFENSGEGIIITDAANNILMVNKAFTAATRYAAEEVIGKNPRILSSGEQDAQFYREMWRSLDETGEWHGEVRNRRKNGELYAEWLTLGAVYNNAGEVTNYVAVFADLTARKQVEERLHFLAFYDALTELPNRVLFIDRLDRVLIEARHSRHQVAVMFLDVDRFSTINETLGHASGDILLKEVSRRLQDCTHRRDNVARVGGDEFTLVLSDIDKPEDVSMVAQEILNALSRPFVLLTNEIFMSASIGISIFPGDGDNSEALIKNADSAMHRAVELGGNNFRFYTLDMNARSYERMLLGTDLRHALERGELHLHYQPLVDMATGRIVGAEALLRWWRQDFGMVAPAAFVPLLEETGLIVQVGEWVLKTACVQNKAWRDMGFPDVFIAVNFSAQQFEGPDIVEVVERVLRESDFDPHHLEIELTEGVLMRHAEETIKKLRGLKAMGIRLSVDDFGTGYSSLSYLKRFPLDTLKIDQSFVHDIPDEPDAVAIVNAIMAMGHSLNLKIIAEGVETRDQMDFLRASGCDIMQGFYTGHAIPHEEFVRLLQQGIPLKGFPQEAALSS